MNELNANAAPRDVNLGSTYQEFMKQVQISEDESLVNEAFPPVPLPSEGEPEGFGFIGGNEPGDDSLSKTEGLNSLGIAQQILVGGGLDAVKNSADLVTGVGEQVRNFEIGGATVEQHLQSVDEALGTGKLFSGKAEIGIASLEKEGGAGVQMARGLVSWLVGFAALKGAGAATLPAGIAADGLAIDRDANLSNLFNDTFPEGHPLRNPLTDALAASQDDSELEKSVKSMIEGAGLTLPFTAIQALTKSLSSFKQSRVKAKQAIKDTRGSPSEGPLTPGADIPAPKPTGPKVSATFDGKEYNITDMELRFDEVNPQKKIDKVQGKFDEIGKKIKEDPSKGKNKKGRDVRTLAQTELEARKELQADPEGQLKELMEKDPTTTITDKDRVKMALIEEASVRKLIEYRKAFKAGDTTSVQKAFDQGQFTSKLFEQSQRFSETASRDLGSGRILSGLKRDEGNIIVDKAKALRRDIDPNVTPESFMRKLDGIEGATDSVVEKLLSKMMGETVRLGGFDMFFEAWVNSLFGVKTQVVNALGSILNMGFQVTETQIASGLRGIKREFGQTGPGVEQGEAFEMLYGVIASAPDNIRALSKNVGRIATLKEVNISRFNKLDDEGIRAIRGANIPKLQEMKDNGSVAGNVLYKGVDVVGHVLTATGKGLLTVDETFKFAAYNAAKRQYARRTAMDEGLEGQELQLRIRQLVNEPSESIKAKAEDFARLATFTQEAGETGQAIQAVLKSAPAAKIVVPFFNVLNNIAKFTGARTPLAVFSKNVRADLAAGGVRADMAQARLASGTMASLGFLGLAMGGGMIGSEPTNLLHRESFRRKGKQPYSLEFLHEDGSKTSVSINRLEPVAFFAGIMADFVKISGELEEGEIDTFVGAYTLAVSKHFLSQTFATGVSDFLNMAMEGDDRFLKNLGSSIIPFNGIMGDIEKTVDPALRDTKTFDRTILQDTFVKQYGENEGKALANSLSELTQILARMKSRTPEFSKDLPARLDAFGEVITTEYGFENPVINTMNPFAMSDIKPNSLEDWIRTVKAKIITPKPQMEGVKITPEEYHDWKKMAGPRAKKRMIELVNGPDFKGLVDGAKRGLLEGIFEEEYANAQFKMTSRIGGIMDKKINRLKYLSLVKAVEKQRGLDQDKTLKDNLSVTLTPTDF
tara:strand:- start:311 stop:3784 length:3474 start_codon:yes stop_codon:yes gene_type:complete